MKITGHVCSNALILCLILFLAGVNAWDNEDLEIFDLVEEINENFYTFMGVQSDVKLADLKRAFRNLSVQLHPDKNNGLDTGNRFRKLITIYEVLKDISKRSKYDLVLKNGLPNWKSAVYYYRHVRKIGIAEMVAIVFAIVTIGQYLISWAAYAEKKYTAEVLLGSKLKRVQRKSAVGTDNPVMGIHAILDEIPKPSILNTLPFQIPCAIWNTPKACYGLYMWYRNYKQEQTDRLAAEHEELQLQRERNEEYIREKEARKIGLKKRKEKFAVQEKSEEELIGFANLKHMKNIESIEAAKTRAAAKSGEAESSGGGFWSDDDLIELIRLVKKHPGGTSARWELIAEQMNRNVNEITFMAGKMKEKGYRLPGQSTDHMSTGSVAETLVQESLRMQSQCEPTISVPETMTNWTQDQQRQLEVAMTRYPRDFDGDRWTVIAGQVDGMTRTDCFERYKHLVQMLRKTQKEDTTGKPLADSIERPAKNRSGGKPRNLRRERKKNIDLSCECDSDE